MIWLKAQMKRAENRTYVVYHRPWKARQVFCYKQKDVIAARMSKIKNVSAPGSKSYLKHYQPTVSKLWKRVNRKDRQEFRNTAMEWTTKCPPQEVQAK